MEQHDLDSFCRVDALLRLVQVRSGASSEARNPRDARLHLGPMQPRRHRNERKRILVVLDTGTHMRGLLMLMEEGIACAPFVSNKYHCTGRQVRVLQQAQWQGATVLRGEAGRVFDAAWYRLDFLPSTPSRSPSCSEPFQSPKAGLSASRPGGKERLTGSVTNKRQDTETHGQRERDTSQSATKNGKVRGHTDTV